MEQSKIIDLQNYIRLKQFDDETKFKLFEILRLDDSQIIQELINFIHEIPDDECEIAELKISINELNDEIAGLKQDKERLETKNENLEGTLERIRELSTFR